MPNRRAFIHFLRYVGSFGRPGPDLSWITDLLGISGTLHPRHIAELAKMEVGAILDLRKEGRDDPVLLAQHGIRFLHLPVRDMSAPSQVQLEQGTGWVLNELHAGRRTVVHCKGGVGRSVVLVCCVLMAEGLDLDEALRLIKSKRWGVVINARQMDSLKEFQQRLLGGQGLPLPGPCVRFSKVPSGHEALPRQHRLATKDRGLRLLFFPGFVSQSQDYKASDAIGYGITAVDAIVAELPRHGIQVRYVQPETAPQLPDIERRRLAWILGGYQALLCIPPEEYDAVFIFHVFQQFPQEVRRIFADLGIGAPVTGYTHGSHWDPTGAFRFIHYPGMEVTDLANFLAMDRVCVVSEYFRGVLLHNVGQWQPEAARRLEERLRVVGLPINTAAIDAARTDEQFQRPTIIFNHSMVPTKEPGLFLDVAERVLSTHDCQVVITRDVSGTAVEKRVTTLQQRFPGRMHIGGTLSLDAYFRLLWQADIQVSTARHETLGISTVEAMYTENCCLLPNRFSYPEITDNYRDALYDTPEELFAKLDHYLQNAEDRRRVARELRRRALRYTPSQVVPRIAAVIAEAVEATRARWRPGRAAPAGVEARAEALLNDPAWWARVAAPSQAIE